MSGNDELPERQEVMHITGRPPEESMTLDLSGLDPATRARIEQAVLDIFSQREYHRVGLIEIARAANVSLQTIYKYYGGKEALLFSSLDSWLGKLAARMIDHLQGIEDYKEKLRKVMWVTLDFFEKNPKVAQLIMSSVYVNTWRKQETYRHPQRPGRREDPAGLRLRRDGPAGADVHPSRPEELADEAGERLI